MTELVCILCPRGCGLRAEQTGADTVSVSGNGCPRGAEFAREELLDPKRTVTSTCALHGPQAAGPQLELFCEELSLPRRLPVRSNRPCPRERIGDLLAEIYHLEVHAPVAAGTVLIENWQGTGIDIIATRSIE